MNTYPKTVSALLLALLVTVQKLFPDFSRYVVPDFGKQMMDTY